MVRSFSVCDLEPEKITKSKCRQFYGTPCILLTFLWIFLECAQQLLYLYTGCPVKLSTLRFCYLLGFQITYKRTSDHFSIAQKIRISKLTLLYFLCEKFIKLQDKMRDKRDFDSIILMADFVPS